MMMTPRTRQLVYWATTSAALLGLVATGVLDLTGAPSMAAHVTGLGYPSYLQHFLGVAKLLGAAVIALPGLRRLKEWAYAGVTFDLLGATYSHIAHRDAATELLLPLVLLALLATSYVLRPDTRRLSGGLAEAH
jgi:hypothetical protein